MTGLKELIFDEDYPFVISVECIFESEDKIFIVQRYVKGEILSKLHERKKRLEED